MTRRAPAAEYLQRESEVPVIDKIRVLCGKPHKVLRLCRNHRMVPLTTDELKHQCLRSIAKCPHAAVHSSRVQRQALNRCILRETELAGELYLTSVSRGVELLGVILELIHAETASIARMRFFSCWFGCMVHQSAAWRGHRRRCRNADACG